MWWYSFYTGFEISIATASYVIVAKRYQRVLFLLNKVFYLSQSDTIVRWYHERIYSSLSHTTENKAYVQLVYDTRQGGG